LALALPMAWYIGMTHPRPWVRWLGRAYLPVALLSIALTGSRGGMIVCMVALLIVPLAMTSLSPGKLVSAIAMLAISGALAVAYVPDTVVQRLATTGESVQDLSLGGRFKLWQAGIHAFIEKPVMGYGTSAYKVAINPEMGDLTQVAHNSYISVLVEEGLVGLFLFLAMLASVFFVINRLPRLEHRFALVLFITLCVAISPLTWEDQKPLWFILAALVGLAHAQLAIPREVVPRPLPRRGVPIGAASGASIGEGRMGPRGRGPVRDRLA
jgi:O-antigen ligase